MQKKRILFIGASKYGNHGDDAYLDIFNEYLGDEYELIFTHPYPDLNLVDIADYLVMGGGGLIYNNSSQHFNYMTAYLERAIAKNIPFAFIGCGVQVKTKEPEAEWHKQLAKWKKYFEKAEMITVRSKAGLELIRLISKDANVKYYPDLVYLIKPVNYHFFDKSKKYFVFIPTNTDGKGVKFRGLWNKYKPQGKRRIILTMAQEEKELALSLANEINQHRGLNEFLHVTPQEACRIIKDSYLTITCRYHGLIMANAMNKEAISCDTRFKSIVEINPEDTQQALGHIDELKKLLDNHFLNNGK